jgi:hypothetical protein
VTGIGNYTILIPNLFEASANGIYVFGNLQNIYNEVGNVRVT